MERQRYAGEAIRARHVCLQNRSLPWPIAPDRDDEWTVSTVACRTTNHDGAAVCAATGETVSLSETHFYVTLRRESEHRFEPAEYDELSVREGALDELDDWLEDGE
ncbi:hypothetical protein [Natrinema versiforme]|uniref:Uncharacterized protein n=1 Tax=Natrinema versiforme JCM 10478 TaxID=1227496 RepID=L9Y0A2_9EURY|nr:hypothetical protein [Natrinema versiforme]ELY66303.1 hypothetical protein C489_13116 [Natrinema versiforme JCM 10478]